MLVRDVMVLYACLEMAGGTVAQNLVRSFQLFQRLVGRLLSRNIEIPVVGALLVHRFRVLSPQKPPTNQPINRPVGTLLVHRFQLLSPQKPPTNQAIRPTN